MDDAIRELIDRQAIVDVLVRYATALDGNEWERLGTCFAAGAVVDYGGPLGVQTGPDAVAAACRSVIGPLDSSQHLLGNYEIEIEGDTARASTYFQAQHTRKAAEGGANFTIGGTYVDELVREEAGWRIKKRALIAKWREGNVRVVAG